MPFLHEVFRLSGTPTITFVEPDRYTEILVNIRTPGRCLVLEGPSGIGKSTTIEKALDAAGLKGSALTLSPRQIGDIDIIRALPELGDLGVVIVDDFHRLPDDVKARLSDFMKVLADSDSDKSKLILIGINKAGQQLIKHAHDLGLRLDVFRLESNPDDKILELISLGEKSLNVNFGNKHDIAKRSEGSFQIAQLLSHKLCTYNSVVETQEKPREINTSIDIIIEDVMRDLGRMFKEPAVTFARGSKLRREGRAPYLHILKWLSIGEDWSLDLIDAMNKYPENKQSINQVIEKGYLEALFKDLDKGLVISQYFHYEPTTHVLSVEDPKMVFYLKNIVWRAFTRQVGFRADYFEGRFDYALSFAGAEREHAKRLHDLLAEREVTCFYDENEQHRIVAKDIEEYLAPIYRTEAKYVVALLSKNYPTKIWTKFESDVFRERFGQGAVIPIRYRDTQPGWFSDEQRYGALSFDPGGDVDKQLAGIADTLCKKLVEERQESAATAEKETLPVDG